MCKYFYTSIVAISHLLIKYARIVERSCVSLPISSGSSLTTRPSPASGLSSALFARSRSPPVASPSCWLVPKSREPLILRRLEELMEPMNSFWPQQRFNDKLFVQHPVWKERKKTEFPGITRNHQLQLDFWGQQTWAAKCLNLNLKCSRIYNAWKLFTLREISLVGSHWGISVVLLWTDTRTLEENPTCPTWWVQPISPVNAGDQTKATLVEGQSVDSRASCTVFTGLIKRCVHEAWRYIINDSVHFSRHWHLTE